MQNSNIQNHYDEATLRARGYSQLAIATHFNDIDRVKHLLAMGASIHASSKCPNCRHVTIGHDGPPSMPHRVDRQCNDHYESVSALDIARAAKNNAILSLFLLEKA